MIQYTQEWWEKETVSKHVSNRVKKGSIGDGWDIRIILPTGDSC